MTVLPDKQTINLDELPKYSDWIAYLLGLKVFPKSLDKNADSINREFGQDKWGALLQKLRLLDEPTIDDANRLTISDGRVPFYLDGKLYIDLLSNVHEYYHEIIWNELKSDIHTSKQLVELGSGYGQLIFKLATLPELAHIKITAGEFTDTGVACLNLLASSISNPFEAGFCDLDNLSLDNFNIADNAIFVTCWAAAYIKGFSRNSLDEILKYRPAKVIHIEPIFEYWEDNSLLHMLWKKYCKMNDYNQTLLSSLKAYESEGLLDIKEEKKNIFGVNPLAPVSIVKWAPSNQ